MINVLDLEMTGKKAGRQICEISVHKIHEGRIVGHFHRYVNPGVESNPIAYAMHKLSKKFLDTQPPIEHHWDDLIEFLGDDPIYAHSVTSDRDALMHDAGLAKLPPLKNLFCCTMKMANQMGLRGITATAFAHALGVELLEPHKAYNDSKMLADALCALQNGVKPKKEKLPPEYQEMYGRKKFVNAGLHIPDSLYTFYDNRIKWTYKGEKYDVEIPEFPDTHELRESAGGNLYVVQKGTPPGTSPDNPWGPCLMTPKGEFFNSQAELSQKHALEYIKLGTVYDGTPVSYTNNNGINIKIEDGEIKFSILKKGQVFFEDSVPIPDYPDDHIMIVQPSAAIVITREDDMLHTSNPLGPSVIRLGNKPPEIIKVYAKNYEGESTPSFGM